MHKGNSNYYGWNRGLNPWLMHKGSKIIEEETKASIADWVIEIIVEETEA